MEDYEDFWEQLDKQSDNYLDNLLSEEDEEEDEDEDENFFNELLQETPQEIDESYFQPEDNRSDFAGIYHVEGARTGQHSNLNSSAIGRGQMVQGTRYAMYKKAGIDDIAQAEELYKTNPEFEQHINDLYRDELDRRIPKHIKGDQREYMILKGWYTGNPFYNDNSVPHPEAGNKLTAGEYARKAMRKSQFGFTNEDEEEEDEYVYVETTDENGNKITKKVKKKDQFNFTYKNTSKELDVNNQKQAVNYNQATNSNNSTNTNTENNNFDFPDTVNKILSFGKANISNITSAIDTSMDLGIRQLADKQNKENELNMQKILNKDKYFPQNQVVTNIPIYT